MTDTKLEQWVAILLRTGVLLAASVVFIGGIGYLISHGHEHPVYRPFHAEPEAYRRIPEIAARATQLDWRAVIQFGLILLIATPILRVALCLAGFALEKDRIYVVVTTIVLSVLLYSFIVGH